MLAEALTSPDLWPLLEKGGLIAGLSTAVVFLIRWVQASQEKLVTILIETVNRNTEALRDVRAVMSDCRCRQNDTTHAPKPVHHEHTD